MPKNKSVKYHIAAKEVEVRVGDVVLKTMINDKHIEIFGKDGNKFVFRSSNSKKTVERWEEVIDALNITIQELKEQRKLC